MKWWNRKGLTLRQSGLLPTFFTLLSPIPRLPLPKKKKKKYGKGLPPLFSLWDLGHMYKIWHGTYDKQFHPTWKTTECFNVGEKKDFYYYRWNRQTYFFLLFDLSGCLEWERHYLNVPLCFSQSGGCRRLINLACLLFCTQWGQTCIAYSKPALRHPPMSPIPCSFCNSKQNICAFLPSIGLSYK